MGSSGHSLHPPGCHNHWDLRLSKRQSFDCFLGEGTWTGCTAVRPSENTSASKLGRTDARRVGTIPILFLFSVSVRKYDIFKAKMLPNGSSQSFGPAGCHLLSWCNHRATAVSLSKINTARLAETNHPDKAARSVTENPRRIHLT